MAIQSGFFNSVNGDRRYDAKWFAQYFASFIGNGVFPNPSTGLKVVEGTNMTTVVKAGKGWINGYFVINDGDYVLQHAIADGALKRIDRVVMRLNHLTRKIEIAIKKGTFASAPVAPSLQRDVEYHELALADVRINNGVTQITQANITDQRLNTSLCGIVHGVVDQVDTTTLFNQYQSWITQQKAVYEADFATWSKNERLAFDAWQTQEQTDFEAWVQSMQDILSGDVAGNLLAKITKLESDVGDKNTLLTTNKTSLVAAVNELFTNANNLKNDWASVIGSPLSASDTSAQLKSKTQNIKNTLVSNLTAKGQSAANTETLNALVAKVSNINTGKKWASGTVTPRLSTDGYKYHIFEVSGLNFLPSTILIGNGSSYGVYYHPDFGYMLVNYNSSIARRAVTLGDPPNQSSSFIRYGEFRFNTLESGSSMGGAKSWVAYE